MIRLILFFLISLLLRSVGFSQSSPIRSYVTSHQHKILQELADLLSIPNVASDTVNIRRNAEALVRFLKQRNIEARLLETQPAGGPPAVYGELKTPGAKRTLVFYMHYDGQPTNPAKWIESQPWQPVLRTDAIENGGTIIPFPKAGEAIDPKWRIYARSASDDKSPIVAALTAIDALRANKIALTTNVKFYLDGDEEAGSPNMLDILTRNKDLFSSDGWIVCDGPVHQNGQKLVYFGVRGIVTAEITVYGAIRDLHSGHYGNWAPNPALMLSQLLASMKDDNGLVTIAKFYDDTEPLGEPERNALAEAPDYDKTLMDELGIAWTEGGGKSLNELLAQPSLTINGISSAYVGAQARTIIPATATARVDMRLVRGNDPARQLERLKEHIRSQGYYITDKEPDQQTRLKFSKIARVTSRDGYRAVRTSMDLPISKSIVAAVASVTNKPVVRMPTLGGSVPLVHVADVFGAPIIGVPIVNYDNNQHSENENLRLQNLWEGIEIYAAILTMK
ncbi:MAG TPA: M20/M25/M40 family metallo-hydrolase [Bacteroidota bacterium]|nr:M20/M25/M40 family metallo-hydrolase [Bacteroidota bacterium]